MPEHTTPDPKEFRQTCARFATGVTVATVLDGKMQPQGVTVNSFTSVSCSPPMVLICLDQRSSVLPHFRTQGHFGICVLCECQRDISIRFAQKRQDKFEGLQWSFGLVNIPLLEKALASFECRLQQAMDAGDHTILIAEVLRTRYKPGRPLLYYGSDYARLSPQPMVNDVSPARAS